MKQDLQPMLNNCLETRAGLLLDYLSPDAHAIHIYDIAFGLSRLPRFLGHTSGDHSYSVAQHSVWVAQRVAALNGNADTQLAALLHDASEAYMGDCPTPLKTLLGDAWRDIENSINAAIFEKFEIIEHAIDYPLIKQADREALTAEAALFTASSGRGWDIPDVSLGLINSIQTPQAAIQARLAFGNEYQRINDLIAFEVAADVA